MNSRERLISCSIRPRTNTRELCGQCYRDHSTSRDFSNCTGFVQGGNELMDFTTYKRRRFIVGTWPDREHLGPKVNDPVAEAEEKKQVAPRRRQVIQIRTGHCSAEDTELATHWSHLLIQTGGNCDLAGLMNIGVLAAVAALGDIPNEFVQNCLEPSR